MPAFTGLYLKIPASQRDLRRLKDPISTILGDMDSDIAQDDIDRISLAIHELCLHIISQGIEKEAYLTVVVEPKEGGCIIKVTAPPPGASTVLEGEPLNVDGVEVGSLALWTAQQLMDEVDHESQEGRESWRMVKFTV